VKSNAPPILPTLTRPRAARWAFALAALLVGGAVALFPEERHQPGTAELVSQWLFLPFLKARWWPEDDPGFWLGAATSVLFWSRILYALGAPLAVPVQRAAELYRRSRGARRTLAWVAVGVGIVLLLAFPRGLRLSYERKIYRPNMGETRGAAMYWFINRTSEPIIHVRAWVNGERVVEKDVRWPSEPIGGLMTAGVYGSCDVPRPARTVVIEESLVLHRRERFSAWRYHGAAPLYVVVTDWGFYVGVCYGGPPV
jgi:hypothetical protein